MHDITTRHVYVAYDPCDTERVAVLNSDGTSCAGCSRRYSCASLETKRRTG